MVQIKKTLLSKKVVLTLLFLIIFAMLLSVLIPQRFTATPEEQKEYSEVYPLLFEWSQRLGMDHVYTASWFAVLLFIFIVSMTLSAYDQFLIARKSTFGEPSGSMQDGNNIHASPGWLKGVCKKLGYIQTSGKKGNLGFIKHPWGYWGNTLLHIGMVIVLIASLWIVLTQKRGLASLWEGAVFTPEDHWQAEESGLAAGSFILQDTVRLDGVRPEFHKDFSIKQLHTELSFIGKDNSVSHRSLSVNNMLRYKGLDIYQSLNFGHAFFVLFTDDKGSSHPAILKMIHPESLEKPSYGEFKIFWMALPYLLQGKYYADVNGQAIDSNEPLLVLRLLDGDKEISRLQLTIGEKGKLGPYDASLVKAVKWTDIIFVKMHGMTYIFTGFAVIIMGGGLTYFMPPRKLMAIKEGDGYRLHWHATKFRDFYVDEKNKLFEALMQEKGI